jgi:microcystin-dependent protein
MSQQFLGQIQPFAFNFAPVGWALCDGQIMSIAQNSALFSLLGTTYGGNGQSTFALPDLRGRVMIHQGQGPGQPSYSWGETGGATETTLLTSNMPQHNHLINASTTAATVSSPAGAFLANANGADNQGQAVTVQVYGPTADTTMNTNSISMTGGSLPISLLQPFLTISICIALTGIFPSRN